MDMHFQQLFARWAQEFQELQRGLGLSATSEGDARAQLRRLETMLETTLRLPLNNPKPETLNP